MVFQKVLTGRVSVGMWCRICAILIGILGGVVPGWAFTRNLGGVNGGTIHCLLSDRQGQTSECHIDVPDSVEVVDIDLSYGKGLLVTAAVQYGSYAPPRFLSEVWLFPAPESGPDTLTYEDRQVLVSFEPARSKQQHFCERTVSCGVAIAVQVRVYEGAHTLLFDSRGEPIEVDWSRVRDLCGCYADWIQPVTWIRKGRQYQLLCRVMETGGSAYLLRYDLESASLELGPDLGQLGEYYWPLINAVISGR